MDAPKGRDHFDLIVIGSGAAAGAGWSVARGLGKSVAVFERDTLGGECPTFACMPTKALLHCAEVYANVRAAGTFGVTTGEPRFDYARVKARKDFVVSRTGAAEGEALYREAGVEVIRAAARFTGPDTIEANGREYTAGVFLVATGSHVEPEDIPGLDRAGYVTFRQAVDFDRLPDSILVIGGGPVGCEFTQIFSTFGARVTLVDQNPVLLNREEPEAGDLVAHFFRERGVRVVTDGSVEDVRLDGKLRRVTVTSPEGRESFDVEQILLASGKAATLDLGLEQAGVDFGDDGIVVSETLQTTNPRVYAAGDVVGPFRFTHAASYQGGLAVRNAFGESADRTDYRAIPRCVFTSPEVAAVGVTEAQARDRFGSVAVGFATVEELSRANTNEEGHGFAKVVATTDGTLVGATVVAPRAGEMIHELSVAVALGAKAEQVAAIVHAFPTFSEVVQSACAKVEAP